MVTTAPGTLAHLLTDLATSGIRLRLGDDGQLRVIAATGRLTGALRERIVARKPEIVAWLAESRRTGVTAPEGHLVPTIVPDLARRHLPFSPSDLQTSFLIGSREGFEHHVRPHQYLEFDFPELDAVRFATAVNRVLHRQRANLVVVRDDLSLVALADPAPIQVRVTDLRGRSPEDTRSGLAAVRSTMERRELPLDRWPWLELEITRFGDAGQGQARLHYNHSNFFCDAPGMVRFLDTVLRAYREPELALTDLTLGFRDCVLALAELERSPQGQAAEAYWRDRIPGWPPAVPLPTTRTADFRRRSVLRRRELVVPASEWSAVTAAGAALGLTPTSVACAVYAEVLGFWSGARHFLINHMISHRLPMHPEVGEVLGNFASLYPLEVDWREPAPFADRVRRLQAQVLADLEHTAFSGAKVLQALNRFRGTPGRAVLPVAVGSALFVGPADRPGYSVLETPQVALDCEFWQLRDGGLWVVWDVIESVFPPGLVDAMQEGFRDVMHRLATDPSTWAAVHLDLLPPDQRAARAALNHSTVEYPVALLHEPLAARAAEFGDRTAVVCAPEASGGVALGAAGGVVLGYAELYGRAGVLARSLRDAGVRAGDRVAVALPKGWAQVVAVHAVLHAGGAYVPVDPSWPAQRLRLLFAETSAAAVVTLPHLVPAITALTEAPVLAADGAAPDSREAVPPTVPPTVPRTPGDLAYVIYTSGSTGSPKGAMLDHRGPVTTILDVNRRFDIGPTDVIFGVSSLCFDLSVYDIFGAAAAGATLVLPPPESGPADWVDPVRRHGVTVWNSVPALLELFVEAALAAGVTLPALRVVLLSGDWIAVRLAARLRAVAPWARVVSLGGATEASIWSIYHCIEAADEDGTSIPYGRPLSHQSWHVLDERGRDVPVWTPGELYIGGTGVALGYLGDQRRTADSFVDHPGTGERVYRTGDIGRYLPGGEIELLGRADFQVKIQGFRVEPGEVEHALLAHRGVRQAAVVARVSGSGRQLAAFVVTDPGPAAPEPEALRAHLADRLPGHLVPSTIAVLERLPLNGNGKVDRHALESVAPTIRAAGESPVLPRTQTEIEVARIWQEMLGLSAVGVHDDFFVLGGQSFAALRVIGLVEARLGRRVSPAVLLHSPTIAALAAAVDAVPARSPCAGSEAADSLVRITPADGADPWFFVHPAGGGVFCYRELAALVDRPLFAFQADEGVMDGGPGVRELAEAYLPALLRVQPHGPYRVGGWSSGAVIAAELAGLLERRGDRVGRLVVVDAPAPLAPRSVADADLLRWFRDDLQDDPSEKSTVDHLAGSFGVFRAVVRACAGYRATTIAAGITVVRARHGSVDEFAGHPAAETPDWGWSAVTTGPVTAVTVPGTHHTLLRHPCVAAVAAAMVDDVRHD